MIGGALPASLAADWLVSAWDQNAGLARPTPAVAALEDVDRALGARAARAPGGSSFAFVTGCQMAHVTALAAARHARLRSASATTCPREGLAGAPPLRIIVGEKRHVTLDARAAAARHRHAPRSEVVPVDDQGRMRADMLADALGGSDGPTIVCAQAGEVNTGAFDDFDAISPTCARRRRLGARRRRVRAVGRREPAPRSSRRAACAAPTPGRPTRHKWLNVPYDCGIAICADPSVQRAAMEFAAPYLAVAESEVEREPMGYTPEFSRRARSVPVYAAIRSLGRSGVAGSSSEVVRTRAARRGSRRSQGATVLNDVVLNQVLVRFDDDAVTTGALAAFQEDGEAWTSGTVWDGRPAIRFSVSSWRTTPEDIERTAASLRRAAESVASG